MSGGAFDYNCYRIQQYAEDLKREIDTHYEKDDWGGSNSDVISDETLEVLKLIQKHIELSALLAKEVEWLYSGDLGDESFIKRIEKILGEK